MTVSSSKASIPNYEFEVSRLRENIVAGEINLEETADSLPGIVIGRELAGILNVKLGGEVVLASLKQKKMTMTLQPKYKKFVVTGIFETGMNEYDGNLAYISIPVAQDLFKLDDLVTGLQVKVRDFYKSQEDSAQDRRDCRKSVLCRRLVGATQESVWLDDSGKIWHVDCSRS